MHAVVERARQAMGLGPDAFLPSTLEAQEKTLQELDIFAPTLAMLLKGIKTFTTDSISFLEATATYSTNAKRPQLWVQGSASEPATATPLAVPAEYAVWFDPGVIEHEATVVPQGVNLAMQRELVAPLEQWLWAHQLAQGWLSELENKRLDYDANRRRLVAHATKVASSVSPATASATAQLVQNPSLAQLAEDAAAINSCLSEYEADAEALDDLLHWLVEGTVRLKALLSDTAGSIAEAAEVWTVPLGVVPPFPVKSSFGKELEVTLQRSEGPTGLGTSLTSIPPNPHTSVTHTGSATSRAAGNEAASGSSVPSLGSSTEVPVESPVMTGHTRTDVSAGDQSMVDHSRDIERAHHQRTDSSHPGSKNHPTGMVVEESAVPQGEHASQTEMPSTPPLNLPSGSPDRDDVSGILPGGVSATDDLSDEILDLATHRKPQPQRGGLLAAIQRTVAEAGATGAELLAAASETPADKKPHSSSGSSGSSGSSAWQPLAADEQKEPSTRRAGPVIPADGPPEPVPGSATWVKEATPPGGAAAVVHTNDTTPTGTFAAGDEPKSDEVVSQGHMHIGPEAPAEGPKQPAPGSATWIKEATAPGGAAAVVQQEGNDPTGTSTAYEQPVHAADTVAQGEMHIGPKAPKDGPKEPAPGSAEWKKEATPPGGAAAPAGSEESKEGAATVTAGSDDNSTGGKSGPDLSKILPTYAQGMPAQHSQPEGGSFGTFLKETLLGPGKHQR